MIEAPMESGEITASAYLVVASAGSWCDIHALVPGSPLVIGRGGESQVALHSNRCSRQHCEIFSENGNWFVRDLKSRNGTRLNDRPLRKVKPLNPGDRLEIAGTVLILTSSICDIEGESLDSSIHDPDTTTAVENILQPSGEDNNSGESDHRNPDRPA
jgi:pSer/pThr/pTyr-binding forkhead associated (FHA) protein